MEIIGTCINCWPASGSLTVNVVCAIAMLGITVVSKLRRPMRRPERTLCFDGHMEVHATSPCASLVSRKKKA
jgi:hypothetical protein